MVHSFWIPELKFGINTIDIGVWRELLVATTNSIWIWCDHWKSIIYVCWRFVFKEPVSSVDQVETCVDFAKIVYRFR